MTAAVTKSFTTTLQREVKGGPHPSILNLIWPSLSMLTTAVWPFVLVKPDASELLKTDSVGAKGKL